MCIRDRLADLPRSSNERFAAGALERREVPNHRVPQRRIGLGGNTRDVLVLLIKGSPVRLRDVNVKAGSDLLASLCKEINRLAAAARHGVQNL